MFGVYPFASTLNNIHIINLLHFSRFEDLQKYFTKMLLQPTYTIFIVQFCRVQKNRSAEWKLEISKLFAKYNIYEIIIGFVYIL